MTEGRADVGYQGAHLERFITQGNLFIRCAIYR